MFKIGFDAKRLFNNYTGLGNYSRTLVKNLATYYPEHSYFLFSPSLKDNEETHNFLNSPFYNVCSPKHGPKAYWRSIGVKKALKKYQIQLYHGLSHEIPLGIQKTGIKSVVTIHDLVFKKYPELYQPIDRRIYDLKFSYACKHADKIIAISESTKQDIIKYYETPPEKIEVIYQSCHERFMQEKSEKILDQISQKYQLPQNFLFYVGSIIERKNLLGIVKAIQQLPSDLKLPLVVVGKGMAYKSVVQKYIVKNGMEKWVKFVEVDPEDLPAFYQKASIFIYPSIYEGFGIPVLEALFSQTPVITSNVSSLPEAGGPHSCLIDPNKPEEIAHGIQTILTDEDLRKKMIQKSFEYAQMFQGDKLTAQLLNLYQKVIA
jgi:glycosyltransferase involved in cell wall biosynthesis